MQGHSRGILCWNDGADGFHTKRHNDSDTSCFAAYSSDQTLQILIMIVRRHVILMATDIVSDAVVADVHDDKQVASADGFTETAFRFTGSETGTRAVYQVGILSILLKIYVIAVLHIGGLTKIHQIVVHLPGKIHAAFQSGDFQRRDG